jgi:hypothetical protein
MIINVLINYLKEQTTKKPNEDKNDKLVGNALGTLVNIAFGVDENKKVLLDDGIVPL